MSKINNKLKQLRDFQKNNDVNLQSIIQIAYQTLGNPVILYDLDRRILAHAVPNTHSGLWERINNNESINHELEIKYANEGFADVMIRPDKVVLLESPNLEFKNLFGKIFDKDGFPVACVSALDAIKPFEAGDIALVGVVCDMIAREISKIPFFQAYPQKILDTYINKLIRGDIGGKVYFAGKVEAIYIGLKDNLYVAVVDISQFDPSYAKLSYYRERFKLERPAFKYSIYSNYIVIITSTNEGVFYPRKCFRRLYKLFEQENMRVGVSSRFENLFELAKYYNEAVAALYNGSIGNRGQRIFVYERELDFFEKIL